MMLVTNKIGILRTFIWMLIIWIISFITLLFHEPVFRQTMRTRSTLYDGTWSLQKNNFEVVTVETKYLVPQRKSNEKPKSRDIHIDFLNIDFEVVTVETNIPPHNSNERPPSPHVHKGFIKNNFKVKTVETNVPLQNSNEKPPSPHVHKGFIKNNFKVKTVETNVPLQSSNEKPPSPPVHKGFIKNNFKVVTVETNVPLQSSNEKPPSPPVHKGFIKNNVKVKTVETNVPLQNSNEKPPSPPVHKGFIKNDFKVVTVETNVPLQSSNEKPPSPPVHKGLIKNDFKVVTVETNVPLQKSNERSPSPPVRKGFLKNNSEVVTFETNVPLQKSNEKPPSPAVHIGFLKVHKAASTTTQSIFLRFGWRRNLTFILPPEYNQFKYPNIISTYESLTKYNILPPPPGKQYDILCNHVVFGENEWGLYLPPDAVYIGTVREPFRTFKSTLNYFNLEALISAQKVDRLDPVLTFLKNYQKFEPKYIPSSFTNNRQSFEYGVDPDIIRNRNIDAFNTYLENVLEKRFKVVIVVERYDESLVLMKRKLNWELFDILYVIKNVRKQKKRDKYSMTERHKPLHRDFAILDYLLYEFFDQRLDKQIKEEKSDFADEVEYFKELLQYVDNFCRSARKHVNSMNIPKTIWNEEFSVSRKDCEILYKGEISFTQSIRKQQYGSATWNYERKKGEQIVNKKQQKSN